MHLRKMVPAAALLALAIPAAAPAATPESATLNTDTRAAMKVTWTGSITDPVDAYDLGMFFGDGIVNSGTYVRGNDTCMQPYCDVFKLTVPEGANELRFIETADDADNITGFITAPDGTKYNLNNEETLNERKLVALAVPGEWTFRVYGGGVYDYEASAEINLPDDPTFYDVSDDEG